MPLWSKGQNFLHKERNDLNDDDNIEINFCIVDPFHGETKNYWIG